MNFGAGSVVGWISGPRSWAGTGCKARRDLFARLGAHLPNFTPQRNARFGSKAPSRPWVRELAPEGHARHAAELRAAWVWRSALALRSKEGSSLFPNSCRPYQAERGTQQAEPTPAQLLQFLILGLGTGGEASAFEVLPQFSCWWQSHHVPQACRFGTRSTPPVLTGKVIRVKGRPVGMVIQPERWAREGEALPSRRGICQLPPRL